MNKFESTSIFHTEVSKGDFSVRDVILVGFVYRSLFIT